MKIYSDEDEVSIMHKRTNQIILCCDSYYFDFAAFVMNQIICYCIFVQQFFSELFVSLASANGAGFHSVEQLSVAYLFAQVFNDFEKKKFLVGGTTIAN